MADRWRVFPSLWTETGWSWALWNLRGDFGILDSGRADVRYEDYRGHKLDRKIRELLRSSWPAPGGNRHAATPGRSSGSHAVGRNRVTRLGHIVAAAG